MSKLDSRVQVLGPSLQATAPMPALKPTDRITIIWKAESVISQTEDRWTGVSLTGCEVAGNEVLMRFTDKDGDSLVVRLADIAYFEIPSRTTPA